MDFAIIDRLLNPNFVFGVLIFVIWIGYLIFSIALVGKVRVLAKTLKTGLSGINVLVAWIHLLIVFIVGVIGMVLIIL